jgi:2-polyprenyl-3-methyl-5-hydroxy-6-metoxy-1,4-benzoquinol methylase
MAEANQQRKWVREEVVILVTEYFNQTISADMSANLNRFLQYIKPGGLIVDVGAGSGRDIEYFNKAGYHTEGIDASSELCHLAEAYTGIKITCVRIQDWRPTHTYDGVWANASLVHLSMYEIEEFILRLPALLSQNGVAYISFKTGIETGKATDGRYFTNMTFEKVRQIVEKSILLKVIDIWQTEDKLNRTDFRWINVILKKVSVYKIC